MSSSSSTDQTVKPQMREIGAAVPAADHDEFRENFPQYGATQWLITEALRAVNDIVRRNPQLRSIVLFSIEQTLLERRANTAEESQPNDTDSEPTAAAK